jgi:hypothetical protein
MQTNMNKKLLTIATFAVAIAARADDFAALGSTYDNFVKGIGGDGGHVGQDGAMQWAFTKAAERIWFKDDRAQAILFEFKYPIEEQFIRDTLYFASLSWNDGKQITPGWGQKWLNSIRCFRSNNGVYTGYMIDQRHLLVAYSDWIDSHQYVLKIADLNDISGFARYFTLGKKVKEGFLRIPSPEDPVCIPLAGNEITQTLDQYSAEGYFILGSANFDIGPAKAGEEIDGKALKDEAIAYGKDIGAEVVFLTSEPDTNDTRRRQGIHISAGFFVRETTVTARMEARSNADGEELIQTIWAKLPAKRRTELAADQAAWLKTLRAESNSGKRAQMVAQRMQFLLGIPQDFLDKVGKQQPQS